ILTSLGIVIGISAVIAMVAAGSGARQKLDERLGNLGKNLILVKAGSPGQHGAVTDFRPLTNADAQALRKQLGCLLAGISASQVPRRAVSSRYGTCGTMIAGITPEMQAIRKWELTHGRFITSADLGKQAAVCLLGQTTRQRLFGDNTNPVGQ